MPVWASAAAARKRQREGHVYGEQIRAELAATDPGLLVLDRDFETQSIDPMFLEPEAGLAWYDAEQEEPRARARRAVAVRGGEVARVSARRRQGRHQAGSDRRQVRLSRRRLRRPRPHALSALRRAGRDVLSRPRRCGSRTIATSSSRAASSGMPSRSHTHARRRSRRRAGSAPSPPITCSTAAVSPTSRPTSPSSRRRRRSASTTCRRSTSPPSRCIRAASPRARCAATARCRR